MTTIKISSIRIQAFVNLTVNWFPAVSTRLRVASPRGAINFDELCTWIGPYLLPRLLDVSKSMVCDTVVFHLKIIITIINKNIFLLFLFSLVSLPNNPNCLHYFYILSSYDGHIKSNTFQFLFQTILNYTLSVYTTPKVKKE
jgi:hypothetical protein